MLLFGKKLQESKGRTGWISVDRINKPTCTIPNNILRMVKSTGIDINWTVLFNYLHSSKQ